jgi:GNAT superfamily N-acetyltransferase
MSKEEIIVPFDDNLIRLPSCLAIHIQLRPNLNKFTSKTYAEFIQNLCQTNQSHICGIIRKTQSEIIILALAFYRIHLTTFDTKRFEIYDLIVDEKERNHGLGTRLFQYLINQAKQCRAPSLILQCDLTNTNAHRFFFRYGLTISSFGFCLNKIQLLEGNNQIIIIDITDLPENENEKFLIQSQNIFRQLRPHLPIDQKEFIDQIRQICQTGPARMIIAINNDDEKKDILGLAIYRISHNIKYSKYIYCDDLVTDENKRSLGVGQCLMNYMKNEAQKLGINRIALDSGCQRGRTHKFYHRQGFHIDQFKFSILF